MRCLHHERARARAGVQDLSAYAYSDPPCLVRKIEAVLIVSLNLPGVSSRAVQGVGGTGEWIMTTMIDELLMQG